MTHLPPEVETCTRLLRDVCGDDFVGAIFFGSKLVHTSPNRHSASDLFVVCESYAPCYRRLVAAGVFSRAPWLLTLTNRWLPPNVVHIDTGAGSAGCKCFFISRHDLERELAPYSPDHFCKGRLSQTVRIVGERDPRSREALARLVEEARVESLDWVPAYLPPRFSASDFCLAMMAQSYRREIRPESGNRVHEVFAAQGDSLVRLYEQLLRERGPAYGIVADGDHYHCRRRPRRRDAYFTTSRIRATLRWTKYVITFENWLDYIVQKLHRRSGVRVVLTDRERRHPFLFLWPKLGRVLWQLRKPSSKPR